jgi:hypothetical protein
MAALWVASFREGDIDQPVVEQQTLALNQAGTLQAVQTAREDSEFSSLQNPAEIAAAGEPTQTDTPSSARGADGETRRDKEHFAALDIETRQPPTPESDAIASPPPPSQRVTGAADNTPAPDPGNDEIVVQGRPGQDEPAPAQDAVSVLPPSPSSQMEPDETVGQSEPGQDEPAAVQEAAPVVALSGGSQTKQAADPLPVKEVTLAPSITKEEKIAEYLDHGRRTLKRHQLLFPENNSAYHYFQQVLKMDPGNAEALHGIEQITARYAKLATEALNNNDKEKAERYIARGLRVNPNDEGLQALRERMNAPPPVKVVAEPPAPVAPAPQPEPEPESKGLFKRVKAIFARQPNDKSENQAQTNE